MHSLTSLAAATPSMNVATWQWFLTIGIAAAVLLFDVVMIARNPHRPSTKELVLALSFYIGAAVLFGIWVWLSHGSQLAGEFYAGWLTEYSLSVDNLFIFLLIMAKFAVPEKFQQTALMWGIIIAIVLRGIFIWLGAAAINNFSWVFYIFGAFLIYTAVKLATEGESDDEEYEENRFMKWVEKTLPSTKEWTSKMVVKENAKRVVTPLFIVVLALGTTDLLFALDSIPAIYGLTKEPYLVLTANLFALMGLRQLYFLLGGLLQKLVYLSLGLSVLLAFIGVKLILHALHENELPFINGGEHFDVPEIPIAVSLGAIVVILGVTTVASLWKTKRDEKQEINA
ncbi:integral membrane protein TerC (tellurium resistance) [Knoellia flava]|uniref:Integral membrane protein TerC (Tellurium resistance) n=2 Tax=Knoellia flava TaxID=913969 RepID=A0A8H9FQV6_9MICO|nr:integral membrane protein TerC (tellurium resistance) [Knoellia flava]